MQKIVTNGLIALCGIVAAAGGYLLVVLPWQRRWGASDEEAQRPLPGDELIPHPDAQWTRAITVQARAAAVWPWLVQIGYERGGYYSYPWLQRLLGLRATHPDQINPCIGYLIHPFKQEVLWPVIVSLFLSVRGNSAIDPGGESFSTTRENTENG